MEQEIENSQHMEDASRRYSSTVKSYLEKIGAPFYDLESRRSVNPTPVLDVTDIICDYSSNSPTKTRFYLKEEYRNPLTNSVKGRAVAFMVLNGIKSGVPLTAKGWKLWFEPTSGNTGRGLAAIANILGARFTAVFSRLDVSDETKVELSRYGAKTLAIGSEYSLYDLEALAKRHKRPIQYYWATPRHISADSFSLFKSRADELRGAVNERPLLKEIDTTFLMDRLLTAGAEALRAPLVARVERGEFEELKKLIIQYIPELNEPSTIVAFICPLGNTSMAFNTLLSQLGFDNVCNIKGGIEGLRGDDSGGSSEYCPLPGSSISTSSIDFVKKLVEDNPEEYYTFMQYENIENVNAHILTTGPELSSQIRDLRKVFCTFGTGGTATGLAKYFGEKGEVYVAFPEHPVEGIRTLHGAEGLAFFQPRTYRGVVEVDNAKAEQILRFFAKKGILIGPSTAIALQAALEVPQDDSSCAIIAADGLESYRSEYSDLLLPSKLV